MEDKNSAVGIWIVVIGVVIVGLFIWFIAMKPQALVKPDTIVLPGSDTTTEKTIIKENTKEILVTPEATPTASPTINPII